MKIAAISDLHCRIDSKGLVRALLKGVNQDADVLLLAGDLTDRGMIQEMEVLLEELKAISIPMIAVLGNHDHEQDQADMLKNMMENSGICVLDSSSCVIGEVGFVGTKGFCGGFGQRRIQPFGEQAIKLFVKTSVDEVVRMETALKALETKLKVGVTHYAPIRDTLRGESYELYPFMGSSLAGDAFDRHGLNVVFHGHSHNGSLQGHTPGQIPVYNVCRFVLARQGIPYFLYEI